MGNLFGTDGVRGIANKELTGELAYKLGRTTGHYLTKSIEMKGKPSFLIGKDTRISGDMLEAALVAGLTSVGIDVIKLGIIPTPGVAYLTDHLDVEGGVMISASHNPIADNGIKFFDQNGYKLTDEVEDEIEDLIINNSDELPYPTDELIGQVRENYSLLDKYKEHLLQTVDMDFSEFKIVIDCANGAAYKIAPEVLKELDANLTVINNLPAGEKINVECGSTYPEKVANRLTEEDADIGIAHDGDADRVIIVDEQGKILDGDIVMAICARNMLKKGNLRNKTLVTTRYSNFGLKEAVEEKGGRVEIARNGDRYVLNKMRENDYNLGGEKSGHIIFLDYNKTGDGLLTAIQLLQVMKEIDKPLSSLSKVMKPWPQRLTSVQVKHKERWQQNKLINRTIKKAKKELGEEGRVFVRASGTEPVIRLMLEGKDERLLRRWEEELAEIIKKELN
jgi:phosphoglucosamine mutase